MRKRDVLRATCALSLAVGAVVVGGATPAQAAPPTLTGAPATTTVAVNGSQQLHLEYDSDGSGPAFPDYVYATGVNWSSSNTAVATVANSGGTKGTVTGKAAGTAVITGTYSGLSAQITVTVGGTNVTHSFVTPDSRTRSYLLYVPPGYSASTPAPLVIAYHGAVSHGAAMMLMAQLNAVARAGNFIVAYPNGTGAITNLYYWNGGSCCGSAKTQGIDDVLFTSMMIDRIDVTQGYNIDLDRVYATGFSNGGLMAHRVGCELANRIAAFSSIGGVLNLGGDFPSCAPSRHVPVMMFHGTTDTDDPYYGNASFHSVPGARDDWLAVNGLSSSSTVSYQNGIVTCRTHASGSDEVTVCTAEPPALQQDIDGTIYDGGGHAIPGGVRPRPAGDFPTQDVSAASHMWTFFAAHPMP